MSLAPFLGLARDIAVKAAQLVADLRRGGSAALELCAVAAADIIIREAGGATMSIEGGRVGDRATVLAATPALIEPLRLLLLEAGALTVAG